MALETETVTYPAELAAGVPEIDSSVVDVKVTALEGTRVLPK